ncbi:MAG: hypothetical protein MI748_14490, partial [Opitutales bacterium]|nr:hypothetical protein [Opitutales bacterium]
FSAVVVGCWAAGYRYGRKEGRRAKRRFPPPLSCTPSSISCYAGGVSGIPILALRVGSWGEWLKPLVAQSHCDAPWCAANGPCSLAEERTLIIWADTWALPLMQPPMVLVKEAAARRGLSGVWLTISFISWRISFRHRAGKLVATLTAPVWVMV